MSVSSMASTTLVLFLALHRRSSALPDPVLVPVPVPILVPVPVPILVPVPISITALVSVPAPVPVPILLDIKLNPNLFIVSATKPEYI